MTEPTNPVQGHADPASPLTRIRQRLPRLNAPADADATWNLVAHWGGALGMLITFGVGGWIAPLIALLVKGNQSPTVRAHAVDALNFQLTLSIVGALVWLLTWRLPVFWPLLIVTLVGVVFGVIGGLRANAGLLYRYPLSARLVK
jgi:uncharacterized Tic20 family protein